MSARLLFVVNDAGFFLSHRLPVAVGARAAGLDVHVAAPPAEPVERVRAEGFEVHTFPLSRRGMSPLPELASVAALTRLYRRISPDVVHHVTIKPVLYGSVAAQLAGVPAVVNAVTGLGWVFITQGWRAAALRAVVRTAYRVALGHGRSRVVFQNPDDRDLFVQSGLVSESRTVLIRGSGVDMEAFKPLPEPDGAPLIVLAGRLLWDKGVGELVTAARTLKAAGTAARFALVGDADPGNPAGISEAQLETWRRESVVELWGRRTDMAAVLASAHIACLPSYREGVPKFLIEAAASGRAIVATDVPGCREIVRPGENGLLVPARDAGSLTEALRALIHDPARRARMGAAGRALAVRDFSVEGVVSQTLDVYEDLLGGGGVNRGTDERIQRLGASRRAPDGRKVL